MNYKPFTSIENPTLAHFRHFSSLLTNLPSTSVENPLQINPFYAKQTQFPKKSNDVSIFYTMDYENKSDRTLGENKPNSNPIKPNFQKAKMNANVFVTKDYRKNDDFTVRINKPNSNPISKRPKMNVTSVITKDYIKKDDFAAQKNKPKTNPILVDSCWSISRIRCGAGMTMREDNA